MICELSLISSSKLISSFDSVLSVSSSHDLAPGHRVAAWNTLCALLDHTAESSVARNLLWSAGLWRKCFNLYLEENHNARPKSTKQLIGSLTTSLRKADPDHHVMDLKAQLARELLATMNATEIQQKTKPTLLVIAQFLAKGIFSLEDLLSVQTTIKSIDVRDGKSETRLQFFLSTVLRWISKGDLGSIVGQLVSVTLDKYDKTVSPQRQRNEVARETQAATIWAEPLRKALLNDPENAESYRSHIFPVLFKRSLSQYVAFLQHLGLNYRGAVSTNGEAQASRNPDKSVTSQTSCILPSNNLLYAALQAGKALGLVEDTDDQAVSLDDRCLYIPASAIGQALVSSSRSARVAGLSLLITSPSKTRPFTSNVLMQLKRSLPHLHADTDANFRSELFSLSQRMYDRMRASSAVMGRSGGDGVSKETAQALTELKTFIQWYLRFLAWQMRPTASYQRHISGLKCLLLFMRSGVDSCVLVSQLSKSASGNTSWSFRLTVIDDGMQRLLLDLLMDPFDDVRQTAASVLELHYTSSNAGASPSAAMLDRALERATVTMLASGRADHADGVAYMYALSYVVKPTPGSKQTVLIDLVERTESMLRIADNDLAMAVDKFPLHGLLTSLRYVLLRRDQKDLLVDIYSSRIKSMLEAMWEVVKPTLCNDAPEGHVPDEMEDVPDISTKDILSYSWRALKEASLLMGTMLTSGMLKGPDHSIERSAFELCFTQLAELRHRGAFSSVAQTWVACCALMPEDESDTSLLHWYNRAIGLMRERLTINTRRSAGLPSLMCGILIADRSEKLFPRAFAELEAISRTVVDADSAQEGSLPQVHAMNCIKDILKNTRLAERSEAYVPTALRLAADSLRSDAWAIRNCGLMLFRAVIDRLLGTNDAYLDDGLAVKKRVDFEQHPELLTLVLSLLTGTGTPNRATTETRNEGVFPALQLLQRARIPPAYQEQVETAVFALTASPSWHVRDKAARTYISYVPVDESAATLEQLLAPSNTLSNAMHGTTLCSKYLLQRLRARLRHQSGQGAQVDTLIQEIEKCCSIVDHPSKAGFTAGCPYVTTAFSVLVRSAEDLKRAAYSASRRIKMGPDNFGNGDSTTDDGGEIAQSQPSSNDSRTLRDAIRHIHNQADANVWLEDRARYLSRMLSTDTPFDHAASERLSDWVQACKSALDDVTIFSRESTARGLSNLSGLWMRLADEPSAQALLLHLRLVLYDLLNDDDEDIRMLAADTACRMLAVDNSRKLDLTNGLLPSVAGQQLLASVLRLHSTNAELAEISFARLQGSRSVDRTATVAEQLAALETEEHALFAEEKQNLYIDEALEVHAWSRVSMHVQPSKTLIDDLATWTDSGLDILASKLASQPDGPLGWTSREDVFVLSLRVIYSAEVLLKLAGLHSGSKVPIQPSELKMKLVKFLAAAESSGCNCLWTREAQRVVEEAMVANTQNTSRLLTRAYPTHV